MLTLGLMSVGILSIACVPGYATIGLLAPLIVLAGRLLRVSRPAWNSAACRSISPRSRRRANKGFYVSWQSASQQAAVMFAALIGVVLNV